MRDLDAVRYAPADGFATHPPMHAFLLLATLAAAPEPTRPNILWIMSDDHAAAAVGCYGGRLAGLDPTPHIDSIAARGVRLANCFCTNSICTPSRATLMTGQFSHVNGVQTLVQAIPPERQNLPKAMSDLGYRTAMIGKWHLKDEPAAFDFYTVLPGQGWYHNPVFRMRGQRPWPQNEFRVHKHVSEAVTDLSLKWLREQEGDQPWFLMHHFKAPHDDFENAERYDFLYADETIPEPDSLRDRGQHGPKDRPLYGTSVSSRNQRRNMGQHMFVDPDLPEPAYTTESYQRYLKKYLRCVRGVDDGVGRLLAFLEESGQADDTIVLYTSDQGFMLGEHDYIDKRWIYEESLRMPFVAAGPGLPRGVVRDEIVTNVDFFPTLLDLAGASDEQLSKASETYELQGRSAVPVFGGQTPSDWPRSMYYRYFMHMAHHDNPAHFGVRTQTAKLVFFYGRRLDDSWYYRSDNGGPTQPHWELYDLSTDPREMRNVYGDPSYEALQRELKAELIRLRETTGDAAADRQYPEMTDVLHEAGLR